MESGDTRPRRVAFVAGATGYTGHALARVLAGAGVDCVAHVRPDSPRLAEWRQRFAGLGATADVTPWEEAAMRARLAELRPDVVFALLGTTARRARKAAREGGRDASYHAVDYGLTALLLRATPPDSRFVYLSSAGVGPNARSPYTAVRWRLESELRASRRPFIIVRPSFITGPDREENRPAERLAAKVGNALLSVAGALGARQLRDRYRSIDADGLAHALARIAFDPACEGRTLHGEDLR